MPRLDIDYNLFDRETSKLSSLVSNLNNLPPYHQKLVAEIVLLRLFSLLENAIVSISTKIACNANYLDGSHPVLLTNASSLNSAIYLFKTHGRAKPKQQLRWTKASDIKNNVEFVIDISDNFYRIIGNNGSFLSEIRKVRNRIAHNNSDSRRKYRDVVRQYYGAYLNNITPGYLLITNRRNPIILDQYIISARVFVANLTKR